MGDFSATCKCPSVVCRACHPMSGRAEQHLEKIIDDTTRDIEIKYRRGHLEHGNDLLDMDAVRLIDEAIAEAMDQIVYLRTLKEKILALRE